MKPPKTEHMQERCFFITENVWPNMINRVDQYIGDPKNHTPIYGNTFSNELFDFEVSYLALNMK